MRAWTIFPPALVPAAIATGCVTDENSPAAYGPDELAAFMGTPEERAARAPYSPPGWPLMPGDLASDGGAGDPGGAYPDMQELHSRFPGSCGLDNVFWVGDMAFGARWGADPAYDWSAPPLYFPQPSTPEEATIQAKAIRATAPLFQYRGHVRGYGACDLDKLPPHVRDPAVVHDARKFSDVHPKDSAIWTRDRWLAGYTGDMNCKECGRNVERDAR